MGYLRDQWPSMLVGVGLLVAFGLFYLGSEVVVGEVFETPARSALLLLLVVGVVTVAFGLIELRKHSAIDRDGWVTTAEVVHRYERTVGSGDDASSELYLDLALPDGHGAKLDVSSSVYFSSQKGDHIEVVCAPGDEASVVINSRLRRYRGPLALLGGTALVIGTFVVLIS